MATSAQGPSFCDYFRSFYYAQESTYHPPVDLSEAALRARGDIAEGEEIPHSVRNKEIQAILAQPQTMDKEKIQENCDVLESHGFITSKHGETPSCYCYMGREGEKAILHAVPPIFFPLISDRGDQAIFPAEDRLLMVELHKRIAQVAAEAGIGISVPRDKLILLENSAQETELAKKYCILSGDIAYLSRDDTIDRIKHMDAGEQRALASRLCFLIQKVGLASMDLDRFGLTSDGRLSIDTITCGVLVAEQSAVSRGASIEKCARIGLSRFLADVKKAFGETTEEGGAFRERIEEAYAEAMEPKLSKWKIVLSVLSVGLLPLIYAIISLVQVRAIQSRCQSLDQLRDSFEQNKGSRSSAENAAANLQRTTLVKSIFSMTDEVPFDHAQSIIDKVRL